jgi:MoaA/NifB/PqqE/SkfB family radical SAM enzyme
LGRHNLFGGLVTNCHGLEPLIEPLLATGGVAAIQVSLDGWNARSQNLIRTPARGGQSDNFERVMRCIDKIEACKRDRGAVFPFVIPTTVISNLNHMHLAEIHELVRDRTQLHIYQYGWFITEDRAREYQAVFERLFGYKPYSHRGYIKSVFNKVDPAVTARQVKAVYDVSQGHPSMPMFFPGIYSEADIRRYYADHRWTAGYDRCYSIYYGPAIAPDGSVSLCRDYPDYTCGNINEQSFYDIWNGAAAKAFRREMKKGLMPVCTRCCGLQGL